MHLSSRVMLQAHWPCEVISWMWIDWLDLPKLTTLRTRDSGHSWPSGAFENPRHITLESDSHSLWMTFRHAQSYRCVSSICIRLQGWRHNQRQYLFHPSLTNRHRSSSKQVQLTTERWMNALCATHPVHHCVRAHHLCANTHTMAIPIASEINYSESLE